MRVFSTSGERSKLSSGRFLWLAAAAVGIGMVGPSTAEAAGWTVYVYNVRSNSGWIRTGTASYGGYTDLYTTAGNCRNAISKRVADNRRSGYDNEAFAIVYQSSYPPSGQLQSYIQGTIVYIPGRGYVGSAVETQKPDTALCRVGPDRAAPAVGREAANVTPFPRRDPAPDRREVTVA